MKVIETPTGHILTVKCEDGTPVECLSLGDYGRSQNVKAQFLGLNKDIDFVPHGPLLPLEEKWVITLSTQKGCSMGCKFCDVPKVGPGRNCTANDMVDQFIAALSLHPEVQHGRINLHWARMGEPTFNPAVFEATRRIKRYLPNFQLHPVISTMMPNNNAHLQAFIERWMIYKNDLFEGDAGLQLSINSTGTRQRKELFNNNSLTLYQISDMMEEILCKFGNKGRKITLNFALAQDTIIDPETLLAYFDPEFFMVKITPLHETTACEENNLHTPEGYTSFTPYKKYEEELVAAGFDTLVFIPSKEEDESRITCGNVVLGDKQ